MLGIIKYPFYRNNLTFYCHNYYKTLFRETRVKPRWIIQNYIFAVESRNDKQNRQLLSQTDIDPELRKKSLVDHAMQPPVSDLILLPNCFHSF